MAKQYAAPYNKLFTNPPSVPDAGKGYRTQRKAILGNIVLAGQPIGDTIAIGVIPAGAIVTGVRLRTSVTLGTSTLAVGNATNAAALGAAATLTTPNTWVEKADNTGNAGVTGEQLTGEQEIFLTIAAANLPGAGLLQAEIQYLQP